MTIVRSVLSVVAVFVASDLAVIAVGAIAHATYRLALTGWGLV